MVLVGGDGAGTVHERCQLIRTVYTVCHQNRHHFHNLITSSAQVPSGCALFGSDENG